MHLFQLIEIFEINNGKTLLLQKKERTLYE